MAMAGVAVWQGRMSLLYLISDIYLVVGTEAVAVAVAGVLWLVRQL